MTITTIYTDASLISSRHAALGVWTASGPLATTTHVSDLQDAELEAVAFALGHQPPGEVHVRLDCQRTRNLLTAPRDTDPLLPRAREILAQAEERGLSLTLEHVGSEQNAAHEVAWQALQLVRQGQEVISWTARVRRERDTLEVRLPTRRRVQTSGQSAQLLIELAPWLPDHAHVQLLDMPALGAHYWMNLPDAPEPLRTELRSAKLSAKKRGIKLLFGN